MRLSEAIRLGSLLVQEPAALDLDRCAIGMAMKAHSFVCKTSNLIPFWDRYYPWLKASRNNCPECGIPMVYAENVFHLFDIHVATFKTMTIERLADFIESIEPSDTLENPSTKQTEVRELVSA